MAAVRVYDARLHREVSAVRVQLYFNHLQTDIPSFYSFHRDRMSCMKYLTFWKHKNSTFSFVGDNRIKDMYQTFVNHFVFGNEGSTSPAVKVSQDPFAKLSNSSYSSELLKADYIWSPYVSKSMIDLFNEWKVISLVLYSSRVHTHVKLREFFVFPISEP